MSFFCIINEAGEMVTSEVLGCQLSCQLAE